VRRTGFTMVELLLVIAIIATLAAILFPVFARAREQARSNSCRMNLLNMGMALRAYAHDHDGLYPPTEDDLSPLHPKYLPIDLVFRCPSTTQTLPMGAPASEEVWHPEQPESEEEPLAEGMAPGPPPAGSPAEGMPPGPPPGAMPGPGMMGGGPPDDYPEGTLLTAFYYRAGRRHNELPLAALVADHEPRHNSRANVLMSDGGIKSVTEGQWRELGFVTPEEIDRERRPEYWREMDEPREDMGHPSPPAEGGG